MIKSTITLIKEENIKRLERYNKLGTSEKVKRVQEKGFVLVNTASAHICEGLAKLEREYKKGETLENITITQNKKTGEILGICFPNIFLQSTFMRIVQANPWIREKYKVVDILMEYFEENTMCHNCSSCSGLCYNNKDIVQYPDKGISELRNLLAYIINPNGLAQKILRATKFRTVFRININGEIHSERMLGFWLSIVNQAPRTTFYTYTKSYELFEEYLKESSLPTNLMVNMSVIEGEEKKLEKFEKLYAGNKFKTVMEIPADAKNICLGDCTECDLCYTELPKEDNTIYCLYHN